MTGGQRAEGQRLGSGGGPKGGGRKCCVHRPRWPVETPLTRLCISGDAFFPLRTQNTYTLSPSLTGK